MSETKKCPFCGEEILTVAKKCKYCGEWLDKKPVEKKMIACPVCGEKLEEGTEICPYCHEKINKTSSPVNVSSPAPPTSSKSQSTQSPQHKQGNGKGLLVFGIVGIIIILIISAFFIIPKNADGPKQPENITETIKAHMQAVKASCGQYNDPFTIAEFSDNVKHCVYYAMKDSASDILYLCKFDALSGQTTKQSFYDLLQMKEGGNYPGMENDGGFAMYGIDEAFVNPKDSSKLIIIADNGGCGLGYTCYFLIYDTSTNAMKMVSSGHTYIVQNKESVKMGQIYEILNENTAQSEAEMVYSTKNTVYDLDGNILTHSIEYPDGYSGN